MRKSHSLMAAFSLIMMGAAAHDKHIISEARRSGIQYNPYVGRAFANGNPFYSPTKSQMVKSKRRAAQKLR
jgi:hypothetical protein